MAAPGPALRIVKVYTMVPLFCTMAGPFFCTETSAGVTAKTTGVGAGVSPFGVAGGVKPVVDVSVANGVPAGVPPNVPAGAT